MIWIRDRLEGIILIWLPEIQTFLDIWSTPTCDLCISSALNAAAFGFLRSEKCLAVCG